MEGGGGRWDPRAHTRTPSHHPPAHQSPPDRLSHALRSPHPRPPDRLTADPHCSLPGKRSITLRLTLPLPLPLPLPLRRQRALPVGRDPQDHRDALGECHGLGLGLGLGLRLRLDPRDALGECSRCICTYSSCATCVITLACYHPRQGCAICFDHPYQTVPPVSPTCVTRLP